MPKLSTRNLGYLILSLGLLGLLGLGFQNCGKAMTVGQSQTPSQDMPPGDGSSGNPDISSATPVPDLTGFTSFNPNTTLGNKIGYWEYSMPVGKFLDKLYPSKVAVSANGNIFVVSACGVFVSKDNGSTFKILSLPGVDERPSPNAFFVDGNNIYIGTAMGVFASYDNGVTFQHILDLTKAKALFNTNPYLCAAVGLGLNFNVFSLYANGNDIYVGSAVGLLVSHDAGATFVVPQMSSGGFLLPPITPIAMITAAGGKIYVANTNGNGAANRFNTAPVGTTSAAACAVNSQLPSYGILVSSDNGVTFTALENVAISAYAINVSGSRIAAVVAGHTNANTTIASGFIHSENSGATFSDVTLPTADFGQEFVPIALSGNTIFTANNSPRNYSILSKSIDGGVTFSNVVVDAKIPTGYSFVTSLASLGTNLYVMTDRGLYESTDGGTTFPIHKSFSSNYCAYPWWSNLAGGPAPTVSASGDDVYFILSTSTVGVSHDGGKSFSIISQSFVNPFELFATGTDFYVNSGLTQNMRVSTDHGATFGAAVSTFTQAATGPTVAIIPESPGGLYVSADGTNQLGQVTANNPGANVSSAYSRGNRIIAGIFAGGIGVYQNGSMVFSNPNIKQNSGQQYIRIRYVNGVFFAVGDQLWASYDNGTTFTVVPGAPHFPQDVYAVGTSIYVLEGGYLFASRDAGHTFAPWTGELK